MKSTKPDYGNWVPLYLMRALAVIIGVLLAGEILLVILLGHNLTSILLGLVILLLAAYWLYMLRCRALFDFNRGGLMGEVHQFLVDHLDWDGEGTLLDVGCGSGALLIRCAKRFPQVELVGVDYWRAEWSYAREQCERNAALEGVADRVAFRQGDAARLDVPDGAFDGVVSNFVFHEVRTQPDKRQVVREALRVLRKGGAFAFQDLFDQEKLYGDMEEFAGELRREGYREVRYISGVERLGFVPRYARAPGMLREVGLLYGRK